MPHKCDNCFYRTDWENANYVCAYHLLGRIKKHPLIWRLFFMF